MSTMTITSRDQYGKVSVTTIEYPLPYDTQQWREVHRIVCPASTEGSVQTKSLFQVLREGMSRAEFERALKPPA